MSFRRLRRGALLTCLAVAAATAAACGGSSSGSGASDSAATARGPITFITGKDFNNINAPAVKKWNAAHPNEKVTHKQQTDKADQQHDDIVQHMQAKDSGYDVVTVDVVWTAEFAAKGWLVPLKDELALDTSALLKPPVDAATYNHTLYAAPTSSDAQMLYYRKDLVPTPPKTLDELWATCAIAKQHGMGCYAGQFAKYEGLTCNVTSAINTQGGAVVDANGKSTIDSPESVRALQMLADHYRNGDIPKEAITYMEEQGRQAFESGKVIAYANWPYAYTPSSTDKSSKVKGKFDVAPLPGVSGPGASTLGGHSAGISTYSKHKATALDFLKFLLQEEQQKYFWEKGSNAPVVASLYTDPELVAKAPFLPTLKTSIENAVPRPVTPFYPAVTKAIQDNAYAAIKGEKTADQAVKDMDAGIKAAAVG